MAESMFNDVVAYAGQYDTVDDAKADFDAIHEMHKMDFVGKYQAALFEKTADGKVKVHDTTSTTRATGAKWGAAIGGVVGLLFPPSILMGAALGAGAGALTGTLAKGWMGSDIKYIADQMEPGSAGVIVVAQVTPDLGVEKLLKKAEKAMKQDITGDEMAAVVEALDIESEE